MENEIKDEKYRWAGTTSHDIRDTQPLQVAVNPFYRRIWNQVYRKNGNWITMILGQPGTGKSWATLLMAYDLQRDKHNKPNFNPYESIFFTFEDLLNAVEKSNKRGKVFILDESGTVEGIQSRNFMSTNNKIASSLFQTMRVRGHIIFVIAPSAMMIDSQIRVIVHCDLTMLDHDSEKSWGTIKLHDPDLWKAKTYRKYLVSIINGERVQWKTSYFSKPPQYLIDSYEHMQGLAKARMLKNYSQTLREKDMKKDSNYVNYGEALSMVQGNIKKFVNPKGMIDPSKIIAYFQTKGKTFGVTRAKMLAATINKDLLGKKE